MLQRLLIALALVKAVNTSENFPASTRRPGEGLLKVLTSGTYMGPSGDSLGTNTKIDNFDLILVVF